SPLPQPSLSTLTGKRCYPYPSTGHSPTLNVEWKHRVHNGCPPIDVQGLPGDKAGFVHTQQPHRVPNIGRGTPPPHWRPAALVPGFNGLEHLRRQAAHHTVIRGPWTDYIQVD